MTIIVQRLAPQPIALNPMLDALPGRNEEPTMMTPPNHFAGLAKIIDGATPADYAVLCGELERLKASLWLKMTIGTPSQTAATQDQLLTAEDVATRLKVTKAYVYKRAALYPFAMREGGTFDSRRMGSRATSSNGKGDAPFDTRHYIGF